MKTLVWMESFQIKTVFKRMLINVDVVLDDALLEK